MPAARDQDIDLAALERALDLLPDRFRGPGGVAGVVHRGRILARRAWGHADVGARAPMTAQRRMPVCSISKHLTCALLLDLFDDPEALEPLLPMLLPRYRGRLPTIAELCHNQSGLRDYWALTVLQGAAPEGRFTRADGQALIGAAEDGQFPPGTAYSYSNGNFRLLADLIVRATGRDFAELLHERIFTPARMNGALLAPDMCTRIDGVTGYEGNDEVGFLPAQSAVTWYGDSGVCASLDDMLAWEAHIDATRDDPASLYNRISAPVGFADGRPAAYGYGLRRLTRGGYALTAHGGGVRGFASYRLHVADRRLSVVVIFNHEASAMRAAEGLMTSALGLSPTPVFSTPPFPAPAALAAPTAPEWDGLWFDAENGLFARTGAAPGGVRLHYAVSPVILPVLGPDRAGNDDITLIRQGAWLEMRRQGDNQTILARALQPLDRADATEIAGDYHSRAGDARLRIEARDGAASIGFEGMLGRGPVERMYPLARDLWTVTSRRAMDAAPPGEWTLRIRRDPRGGVAGLTIGCWLARGIDYDRTGV